MLLRAKNPMLHEYQQKPHLRHKFALQLRKLGVSCYVGKEVLMHLPTST